MEKQFKNCFGKFVPNFQKRSSFLTKKEIIAQRLFLWLLFIIAGNSYAQNVTDYGDLPLDRLAPSRWQNLKWDDSGTWQTIDVTTQGIMPNSAADIAPKVMDIINNGSGKRILKFPAGTFQIKSGLNIGKGDIQIVGAGSSTKFMLSGGANPGSIYANGSRGDFYNLANDAKRGDNTLTLTSTSGLNVGDYFIVTQPGSATRPGASGDETQIFKITAKSGNALTLDMKFGIPFKKATSQCQKLTPKKNLRFHNFYMERVSKPTDGKSNNLSLNTVQNVEISKIESNKTLNVHITVFRGREAIIHDNNVYGNYGGGGGFQYGISFNFSTNCHITNNVASNLRHHFATQFGTNHSVIAYNRALPPYNDYADFGQHNSKGCHNNLFEGNYGREIFDDANPLKSWGTRYTMWYRNHATSKIGSENEYVEYMNIIGNELKTNASGIKKGSPGKFTLAGANIVSISGEGGTGTMVWGDLSSSTKLPASLFLPQKPSYVSKWPLYGPSAPSGTISVTSVSVSPNNATLNAVGATRTLTATVNPSTATNKNVTWTTSNVTVATVNANGVVTAVANGTATITVKTQDGNKTATAQITVSVAAVTQSAYLNGTPLAIPGTIEAENFDNGGQGVAYNDTDNANTGNEYRTTEGVDVETSGEGGFNVGWAENGEWLEYTVTVARAGNYKMDIRYAALANTGNIHVDFNGANVTQAISLPPTSAWQTYKTVSKTVTLNAGTQVMRVAIDAGGINLNKITLTEIAPANQTYTLSPIEDAFLEGSTRYNTEELRVENGKRKTYLLFDLSQVSGTITEASLKLGVSTDAGDGTIVISKGNSANWTENNLSTSNAPSTSTTLGSLTTTYNLGQTYTWSLSSSTLSGGGKLCLILTHTSGNDVSFGSDEITNATLKPVLTIKASPATATRANQPTLFDMYPNPATDNQNTFIDIKDGNKASVLITNTAGTVIFEKTAVEKGFFINPNLITKKGLYFITVQEENNVETKKLIVN